jgi:hypothetical protein
VRSRVWSRVRLKHRLISCQPDASRSASFLHDSKIAFWGVSVVFAEEECEDWEAEKSWDFLVAGGGGEA